MVKLESNSGNNRNNKCIVKMQEEEEGEKKEEKSCLTGEVFICTSVVHANIKHLMSAFF